MSTEELKEYLNIIIDMEKNVYLQEKVIRELQEESECLGIEGDFFEPEKTALNDKQIFVRLLLRILEAALVIRIGCAVALFEINKLSMLGFAVGTIVAAFGIYWFLSSVFIDYIENRKDLFENKKEIRKYKKILEGDRKRVEGERFRKAIILENIQQFQMRLRESRNILKNFYDLNVIYPKYRNLVMICAIYEYICAGRCTTLEGHEGAYNILEMEMRMDKAIFQLDKITIALDDIKYNQGMIYSSIRDSNMQIEQILEGIHGMADKMQSMGSQENDLKETLAEMRKNSEIAVYQAERIQKELEYRNRMDYLSGRNDKVFFNQRPI